MRPTIRTLSSPLELAHLPATRSSSLEAQRFHVQFTATEEFVRLIEEAQALLSDAVRQATFVEIQLCAMRAFVASLKKRKYGARNTQVAPQAVVPQASNEPEPSKTPERTELQSQALDRADLPRRRGRHLPAAVRRAVFARDQGRCSYVDADGHRCREARRLEFHHLDPFALGGGHNCENVALRCRAHNVLAAEADFGRRFMQKKSGSLYYEPFSRQSGSE
jgi:5-methylcytosine-specific restriction endonuclease McrA